MKWPVPDAVDLMGNYLDDFPEDAFDSFDSVGLQKVLDEWFEKANAAPPRFWMIDPKVVVIFDPERAPEKLGEGS